MWTIDPAQLISVLGIALYLLVDLFTGFLSFFMFAGMYWGVLQAEKCFGEDVIKFMVCIHTVAWIFQVSGHFVFEKRAPAFASNILLTVVAPFFVIFEIITLFGYKKEMIERVQVKIDADIAEYRKGKKFD